jgi:hypothetical protein
VLVLFTTASLWLGVIVSTVWVIGTSTAGGIADMVKISLSGITIVQGWIYFNNNNDKWHLRLLVRDLSPLRGRFLDIKQVTVLV